MSDYSFVSARATLAGDVRLGRRSYVALGASVKQGVSIGADSVVGANRYLNHDLGDRVLAFGTPARVMRTRTPTESYL